MKNKTIKQLWEETPSGQAVKDEQYQYFCHWMTEKKIPLNLKELCGYVGNLFDMTVERAIEVVAKWLEEEIKLNPNFIDRLTEDKRKEYFG